MVKCISYLPIHSNMYKEKLNIFYYVEFFCKIISNYAPLGKFAPVGSILKSNIINSAVRVGFR